MKEIAELQRINQQLQKEITHMKTQKENDDDEIVEKNNEIKKLQNATRVQDESIQELTEEVLGLNNNILQLRTQQQSDADSESVALLQSQIQYLQNTVHELNARLSEPGVLACGRLGCGCEGGICVAALVWCFAGWC